MRMVVLYLQMIFLQHGIEGMVEFRTKLPDVSTRGLWGLSIEF